MSILLFILLGVAVGGFLSIAVKRIPFSIGGLYEGEGDLSKAQEDDLSQAGLLPKKPLLRHFLLPAFAGAIFGYTGARYGFSRQGAGVALYCSTLLLVAAIDFERHLIPNVVVIPATILAIALSPLLPGPGLGGALLGALVGFAGMLIAYIASRGQLGEGDVKLAAFLGATCGLPMVLLALAVSFAVAGVAAILLLAVRAKTMKDVMPLGPFLATGGVAILLWGSQLARLYIRPG